MNTTLGVGLKPQYVDFVIENPFIVGKLLHSAAASLKSNGSRKHRHLPDVDCIESIVDQAKTHIRV
jgi:hypothetical protein